jgi:rare lipoprotein A
MRIPKPAALVLLASLAGCYAPPPPPPPSLPAPAAAAPTFTEVGLASWYGAELNDKRTASGEPFNRDGLTAAHRTLPLDTHVRVTNLENGRSVVVRINDRGPHARDHIIDLSERAALALGIQHNGVARVRVEVVKPTEAGL